MARRNNQQNPVQPRTTGPEENPQGRYWIGTIWPGHGQFVPTEALLGKKGMVWIRGQQEVGGEREGLHWQLFCAFKEKIRRKALCSIINGSWELTRSEAAEEYVWKEDTKVAG